MMPKELRIHLSDLTRELLNGHAADRPSASTIVKNLRPLLLLLVQEVTNPDLHALQYIPVYQGWKILANVHCQDPNPCFFFPLTIMFEDNEKLKSFNIWKSFRLWVKTSSVFCQCVYFFGSNDLKATI